MKKTSRNDVTGDLLRSKPANDMFEEGWDRIFGKKENRFNEAMERVKELEKSRIDIVGQNGNDGLHYTYELDKSTGEVIKKDD